MSRSSAPNAEPLVKSYLLDRSTPERHVRANQE